MSDDLTMRERLEAQIALFNDNGANGLTAHERAYQMAEHAVAALAALDQAAFTKSGIRYYAINPQTGYRLIPDPVRVPATRNEEKPHA